MKDPKNLGQTEEETMREIAMVHALTEAITTRWQEAQLEPSPGDDVKAGLAALEFLEAARDCESPWDSTQLASIIDIDQTTVDARGNNAAFG